MPAFLNRKKKPSGIWPASPALRESAVRFPDRGKTERVEGGKNRVG